MGAFNVNVHGAIHLGWQNNHAQRVRARAQRLHQGDSARAAQPQRRQWPRSPPMRRNANHGRVAGRAKLSALDATAHQPRSPSPAPLAAGPGSSSPAPACLFTKLCPMLTEPWHTPPAIIMAWAAVETSVLLFSCWPDAAALCRQLRRPTVPLVSSRTHAQHDGRIASRVVFWPRISLAWAATPGPLQHPTPRTLPKAGPDDPCASSTVPSTASAPVESTTPRPSPSSLSPIGPRRETDRV
jgi:hypothetical protein